MEWAYGVTTVNTRVFTPLFQRTLHSLAVAGFDRPRLFVDGVSTETWEELVRDELRYPVTLRDPLIRTFGNWMLSALELYIRQPLAERYAIFQDDLIAVRNLRQYLEAIPFPQKGYWNLYTFPHNEREKPGWHLSDQMGKGAVGTVFDNEGIRAVLSAEHMINRPLSERRGWRNVDGGIVTAMRKAEFREYVHTPSLLQHTGERSSMGSRRHQLARSFPGEDFDALTLLGNRPIPAVHAGVDPGRRRIGLVGYHCPCGLGEVNRQIATYIDISSWLVKPHAAYGVAPPLQGIDVMVGKDETKVQKFLEKVDVVLFAETPYFPTLIERAKKLKKRIVCVPMIEWTPKGAWTDQVDLFICPTSQCYEMLKDEVPCVCFPWPFDTDRFIFRQREMCQRFLFLNGHGGWEGRKGAEIIRQALLLWPDLPLTIRSQKRAGWPPSAKVEPPTDDNAGLYRGGDVLLLPHSVDGIGLELMEALSSGMPVIATDGEPWREHPLLGKIRSRVGLKRVKREIDWHTPDPKHLVEICRSLIGVDLAEQSLAVRQYAEDHRWQGRVEEFSLLVRSGFQKIALPFRPREGVSHASPAGHEVTS